MLSLLAPALQGRLRGAWRCRWTAWASVRDRSPRRSARPAMRRCVSIRALARIRESSISDGPGRPPFSPGGAHLMADHTRQPPDDQALPRADRTLPVRGEDGGRAGEGGLARYDPLRAYMAEVARHPVLSREEEHALAVRYHETGRRRRRLQARRLQPPARRQDRARVPAHRVPAPRPRPGGEHRPHAGGEEVRPVEGGEALVVRRLVDPRLHHPVRHGELADGEARDDAGAAEAVLQPRARSARSSSPAASTRPRASSRRTSRSRRRRSRRWRRGWRATTSRSTRR